MVAVQAARAAADPSAVEAAFARLGHGPGLYFGVDAGVPGLHPLQATLMAEPDVALHVFEDGLQVQTLTGWGEALLRLPEFTAWSAGGLRGRAREPLDLLRGWLACFPPSAELLLLGALRFAAHRLAAPPSSSPEVEPLGIFYFARRYLHRDAQGRWEEVTITLQPDPEKTVLASAPMDSGARTSAAPAAVLDEPAEPRDDLPPGGYAAMVQRARAHLRSSPLVSLTLSQSYRRRVQMPATEAFARLRAANPAPASFFLNDGAGGCLFGASPDLQLVVRDGEVITLPVCGTVARAAGAVGEAESVRELLEEAVDAAALAVCTDALRNDLAPLCEPGSLELRARRLPMSLATVVHTVDHLAGRLRSGADAWDAVAATAAPVMLTGTPRALALQAIEQFEASPRNWYGGMAVQVAGNGDALVGTLLRAALVRDGIVEVRTGGDLLADSDPQREEAESRLKTRSLWRAFGLEASPSADAGALRRADADMPRQVRLVAGGDAFAAGLADCLAAMGCVISDDAPVTVLAGEGAAHARLAGPCVALGEAAARLLAESGFEVTEGTPENGRLLRCNTTADAPSGAGGAFIASRYLRSRVLATALPPGWTAWVRDSQGEPQLLCNAALGLACFLFRPDSMLSQPAARELLVEALSIGAPR